MVTLTVCWMGMKTLFTGISNTWTFFWEGPFFDASDKV